MRRPADVRISLRSAFIVRRACRRFGFLSVRFLRFSVDTRKNCRVPQHCTAFLRINLCIFCGTYEKHQTLFPSNISALFAQKHPGWYPFSINLAKIIALQGRMDAMA